MFHGGRGFSTPGHDENNTQTVTSSTQDDSHTGSSPSRSQTSGKAKYGDDMYLRGKGRPWMLDSGVGVHMLHYNDWSPAGRRAIRQLNQPLRLSTANGVITSDSGFTFELPHYGIIDEVHVTKNAPRGFGILSVGRLRRKCDCALTLHPVIIVFSDAHNKHWNVGLDGEVPMLYMNPQED